MVLQRVRVHLLLKHRCVGEYVPSLFLQDGELWKTLRREMYFHLELQANARRLRQMMRKGQL
jgi:hypothetical protein